MKPVVSHATRNTRAELIKACWATACASAYFGYAEIIAEQKISSHQAACIVRDWLRSGLVLPVEREINGRKLWKTIAGTEGGFDPSALKTQTRIRTRDDNIWTAMRGLKSFSPTELAAHANTDTVAVGIDAAQAYCRALLASGHLTVARKAQPGRKEAIYRLARNTGPRAPREKRVRAVIDDNTDAVVVISGVAL